MNLLKIVYSSIRNTPNIYRSIVGNRVVSNISNNTNSEIYKNNWSISTTFYIFTDTFIPSLPFYCPSWMPNIIKKTIFGGNSIFLPDIDTINNPNPEQSFLFINGILTNETIIQQNIKLLKQKFNRPIQCVFNKTDSFIMDLLECAIGKLSNDLTEASLLGLSSISKILLNPEINKLVIICHSQGTIITAQILRNLHKFGLDKLEYIKKIEIYAFGCCASNMKYLINDDDNNQYPYMEHFANENDIVAKMGCNHSKDIEDYIDIDGKIFINKGKSGHLFNSHYLDNFVLDYPESKLISYL